ncbi:MAG: MopE-related protein [Myxococcota bacterium]
MMLGPVRFTFPITALGLLISATGCPGSDDVVENPFGNPTPGTTGAPTSPATGSSTGGTGDDQADGTGVGDGGGDSGSTGADDGSGDAGCSDEPEVCNGEDDNCDGVADEGLDEEVTCGVGVCEVITSTCIDGMPVECEPGEPNPEGETCDGTDDDCDGEVDEDCDCINDEVQDCYTGDPLRVGVGLCAQGTQTCVEGQWGECVGDVTPEAELCDGLDNNCDGTDDEGDPEGGGACDTGLEGACSAGTEACIGGALSCEQDIAVGVESCNDIDDDCNGFVDDGNPGGGAACDTGLEGVCGPGTEMCTGGAIVCEANFVPGAEICNGADDDCDGVPDDGNPGGGGACDTGLLGVCSAGTEACVGGGIVCQGDEGASAELCDGLDNDCDGVPDDGDPEGGGACATGLMGVCGTGVETCSGGGLTCDQTVFPSAETCDGLDNNCDGVPDEGNPGGGAPCVTGLPGVCSPGTLTCSGGVIVCEPNTPSSPEVCNGLDDDCDGFPDEGDLGSGECDTGLDGPCGTGYEFCTGGVLVCTQTTFPETEVCGNGIDENCDGVVDDNTDDDGDGYGVCDNDCCDTAGPNCADPGIVNPGAFEDPDNMVDDDCDGLIDNSVPLCGAGLASNSNDPLDYARAIDLCQFTTEAPPIDQQIWGVIDADLWLADDTGAPNVNSRSIRPLFGPFNTPQRGTNFSVLSTGFAAAPGQANPAHGGWEAGNDMGAASDVGAPAGWLAANGGNFPNAPGCAVPANTTAFDSAMLRIRIRVPTNANSFSVDMYFMSAEYPEYVCTPFNDFFVTLVDSTDPGNPPDSNIAIYDDGANQWPVGVNLVSAAPGLFTECDNGETGCALGPIANYAGCTGETGLVGTGFDDAAAACAGNDDVGGGTGWLNMSGNVTPGEVMEIRFTIWDTGDSLWDSVVLLDNWQWSIDASDPGIGGEE